MPNFITNTQGDAKLNGLLEWLAVKVPKILKTIDNINKMITLTMVIICFLCNT